MIQLKFHGHSCFQLDFGTHRLLIDPFLTGNPKAVARADSFEHLDAILVTHGHGDHLGDAVELSKRYQAPVIAPFELATYCQRRGASVHPMHIGGGYVFDFGRVTLTIAHHGSAVVDKGIEYTGNPCGFLVDLGDLRVYHAGDTGLFYDMALLGARRPIDVALLPIGDNFTMGPEDAAVAADLLKPRFVVPMHYGTFDVLEPDARRFVAACQGKDCTVVVLTPGESRSFA